MKSMFMFATLLPLLFLSGCTLPIPPSPTPPANNTQVSPSDLSIKDLTEPPVAPNATASPPIPLAPPTPVPSGNDSIPSAILSNASLNLSGWNAKNALAISMLKPGERMAFSKWQLQLSNFSQGFEPSASMRALDASGNELASFAVSNDRPVRLTLPDRSDFIINAVFAVGGGVQPSLQVQVYEAKDMSKSNLSIQVGQPQNAFTVDQMLPSPPRVRTDTLSIGGRSDLGAFQIALVGIDRTSSPALAQFELMDAGSNPVSRFALSPGQMVNLHMPDDVRYAVVLRKISSGPDVAAQTDTYKITVFLPKSGPS